MAWCRRLPPHATELQRCEPRLSPPTAGCPHPSRCSAKAQHRATFPKGEPRRLPPHATELQRCEPRLSPPTAGCPHPSRCSAKAQHRATFPKGKARAAAAAHHRITKVRAAAVPPQAEQKLFFPKEKAFPRIHSRVLLHRGVYSVIIHLIIRKMRRKDYLYERKEKTPRRPL